MKYDDGPSYGEYEEMYGICDEMSPYVITEITPYTHKTVSDLKWRTKTGEYVRLGDMEDKHIRNSALLLMDMGYSYCKADRGLRIAWLTAFAMEWNKRMKNRQKGISRWVVR